MYKRQRLLFEGSMNDLRQYALQSGFAADNLEDVFLSMVEKDNMDRKQREMCIRDRRTAGQFLFHHRPYCCKAH